MFGEEIEEDFYDDSEDFYNHDRAMEEYKRRSHQLPPKSNNTGKTKRLKKKIVYVYESDSDEDEENKKIILNPSY